MSDSSIAGKRPPKRDYILLPLTVVLTLAFIASIAELSARLAWPEQPRDRCEVSEGSQIRTLPNCRAVVKAAEGRWVEYRYNECGYRSAASCGPKPPKSVRIVTIGTSISRGFWVSYGESFTGRLEQDLSRSCERPVEFQNISFGAAAQTRAWHRAAQEATPALRLDPDALVLVVSNFDLVQYTPAVSEGQASSAPHPPLDLVGTLGELRVKFTSGSRAMTIALHFAFSDPDRYLRFFIKHGDSADYLRPALSEAWRFRLETVDETLGSIAAAAHAAHVPLFLMLAPPRPAVLLAHEAGAFPALDERVFPKALAEIAVRHGAIFVDPAQLESTAPNWDNLFLVADGHPNAEGHRLMAAALRSALVEYVAPLRACGEAAPATGKSGGAR
jgi:GDSL-like Lipase/Acylhydrolase family